MRLSARNYFTTQVAAIVAQVPAVVANIPVVPGNLASLMRRGDSIAVPQVSVHIRAIAIAFVLILTHVAAIRADIVPVPMDFERSSISIVGMSDSHAGQRN